MKDLYIIGAGGFGREVAWLVERINAVSPTWEIKGFLDDNPDMHGTSQDDYPVLGGCDYLNCLSAKAWVVCAVGSANVRRRIIEKVRRCPRVEFATVVDPSVLQSHRVAIGEGSIICAGTILTVDITIGRHVIINLDCTVGHDAVIGDYVTMYPSVNISGNVTAGTCVELGTGAQVIQGKTIADDSIIGAGAVIVKDITEPGTYIGVPARRKQ
jgi:sugar O-acyltransferase (sialic acid O-acetyltransferase NeuD family)